MKIRCRNRLASVRRSDAIVAPDPPRSAEKTGARDVAPRPLEAQDHVRADQMVLGPSILRRARRLPRVMLRLPILAYRYTLSAFMGRQCRYLPTCSAFADEAIERHGAWAGGWMAAARLCRCHPWGGQGFDPVPGRVPAGARWTRPWRYGVWRQPPPLDADTRSD